MNRPSCLYPLPDGRQCCECDNCQDTTDVPGRYTTGTYAPKRGSEKVGPSEDYLACLRGEITSEEYARRARRLGQGAATVGGGAPRSAPGDSYWRDAWRRWIMFLYLVGLCIFEATR